MSLIEAAGVGGAVEQNPTLEAKGVTVRFGGLVALSDVSVSVPPGTIVGLVGPNGAGKTTLFGVVSGLLRPNAGEVFLDGRRVTTMSAAKRARLGLARTFQQLELFMGLTVREHVVLGYRIRKERRRLWSDLFTAGALHRESADEKQRVNYLVDLLGLTSVANTPAASLPLGTARRVEVARALATGPSIVLLDEPSSGLDAHETSQLGSALRRVVDEEKVSMLLVEHDVAMVLGLSSSVTVLDFGLCIAQGTPDKIRNDPAVRSAYLGDDEAIEGSGSSEARDDPTDDAATGEPAIAAPAPDETVNDEAGATS
jgi:ABC-type branched-subunit amino acid transport system ATPase component